MEKIAVDIENVNVPAGTCSCFKIAFLWDWNADGVWDNAIDGSDYVSGTGIVKREFIIRDIYHTDSWECAICR